jgi:hypothetical protein
MRAPWDRGGLRTYLLVVALLFAQPGSAALWWGAGLLLCGVALQVYAKGCLRQDQVVSMAGPYRFVRHPFYAANLIVDGSIALMSGWWPLVLVLPVWWLFVYLPTMRQEEARLSALFPELYPSYQHRLPRLVPLRRPLAAGGEAFSWANPNISSGTVLPRALRISGCPLIFLLWGGLRTRGLRPLREGDVLVLTAVALLITIYVLSRMLTRHLTNRKRVFPANLSPPVVGAATAVVVLLVAATVRWGEVESSPMLCLGLSVLAASFALHFRSGPVQPAGIGAGLVAAAILCELPWLAALPILAYAGLALDARIERVQGSRGLAPGISPRQVVPSLAYSLVTLAGVMLAVTKEML